MKKSIYLIIFTLEILLLAPILVMLLEQLICNDEHTLLQCRLKQIKGHDGKK